LNDNELTCIESFEAYNNNTLSDKESADSEFGIYIQKHQNLLDNIRLKIPDLINCRESADCCYIDCVYRFYHQSFKVYLLQIITNEMVSILCDLAPEGTTLNNDLFLKIIKAGTGLVWKKEHNKEWMRHTQPILEAYFHANFMITMAIKYGKEFEMAPTPLPQGWAALLYLYGIR